MSINEWNIITDCDDAVGSMKFADVEDLVVIDVDTLLLGILVHS